ncbi:hypothetical protein Cni_G23397 [Canna indica]|uniref:Uncharacterized protein n=1 Tax=Canna indica TaxID=4628 RepID=A0AAQ3KW39_9LILI|nr:hypothetical protein Cni_G23397 [Canna indica]
MASRKRSTDCGSTIAMDQNHFQVQDPDNSSLMVDDSWISSHGFPCAAPSGDDKDERLASLVRESAAWFRHKA